MGDSLSFNFTDMKEFSEGEALPDRLDNGIYYVPYSQIFSGIDSFGLDSGGGTLYFFQVKSEGAEPVLTESK